MTCAIEKKLILPASQMDEEFRIGQWEVKVYCDKHQALGKRFIQQIKFNSFLKEQAGYKFKKIAEETSNSVTENTVDNLRQPRKRVIDEIDLD